MSGVHRGSLGLRDWFGTTGYVMYDEKQDR